MGLIKAPPRCKRCGHLTRKSTITMNTVYGVTVQDMPCEECPTCGCRELDLNMAEKALRLAEFTSLLGLKAVVYE